MKTSDRCGAAKRVRLCTQRRLFVFLWLAIGLAIGLAHGATPAITVPPLDFRERVLANGLRVITLEDHASPTVGIEVVYQVGGKDDPSGRSGFAHLFEHLMFKSTKYLKAEQFDRMTEDVGGMNNAATREDITSYFEVVPSNHLERLLWAEAERMQNLDVVDANFTSERAVVKEEYRERVLANPYGRFYESFAPRSYAVHPYRRGVIGNIDELEAASLEDVHAFHRTYYRPDNAILIVVGDFDPKEARRVDRQVLRADCAARLAHSAGDRDRAAAHARRALSRNGTERAAAGGRTHVARAAGAQSRRRGAQGRGGAARQRRVVAAPPGARLSRADCAECLVRRGPARRPGPSHRLCGGREGHFTG